MCGFNYRLVPAVRLAREMIERTRSDPTLLRLTFFSALEGHALSDMMFRSRVQQVHDFLSRYIARRIAAIILLQPKLDENYNQVKSATYDWPPD